MTMLNSKLNEDAGDSGVNDAAQKAADDFLAEQEHAQREAEALALTEETVESAIADMTDDKGRKPTSAEVRVLCGKIAFHPDDGKRNVLFITAKVALKGDLKKIVDAAKSTANIHWSQRREDEAHKTGSGEREKATSEVPLPPWGSSFGKHQGRTYVYGKPKANAGADVPDVPLHSPLRLRSSATYPDRTVQGLDHVEGIIVEFENRKGLIRSLVFRRSQALSRSTDKEGMFADLANAGLSVTPAGIERLQQGILAAGDLGDGGEIYDLPGWKGDVFLTPGRQVIGQTNLDIRLHRPLPGVKQAGTLEKWKEAIAPAFCPEVLEKAPQIPVTLLFAFVACLADRADEEASYILSLAGRTTRLKTYSLRLKASVWGSTLAKHGRGILCTFNSTPNKLEDMAIERSGCGLAIDDSTLTTAEALSPFIYRLVTGMEKGRKNEEGRPFTIACTLTSEVPIQQFLRAGGAEPPPGLMSRLIEIPILDNRVSDKPIDTLAGAFSNYGHAGPVFVKQMLAGGWDEQKIKAAIRERVAKLLGGTGEQEQSRRASRGVAFVGLAAEIAKEAKLIPAEVDVDKLTAGLWELVKAGADTSSGEVGRVKHNLAAGIRDGSIPIYTDKGIALATSGGSGAICLQKFGLKGDPVFVLTGPALQEIIGPRATAKDVAKILADGGYLYRQQPDRLTWKADRDIGVGDVPAYVLYARAILGEGAEDMIQEHWSARRGSRPRLESVPVGILNREVS